MPNYNWSQRQSAAVNVMGIRVDRATADCLTGAAYVLFNIVGGRVLMTNILGEVTTQLEAQADNVKLQSNPTTGTTVDLCAVVETNGDNVGTLYTIAGAPATAMQVSEHGAGLGMSISGIVLPVGAIECVSAADRTGSIKWSVWYVPIDDGAYVTAA